MTRHSLVFSPSGKRGVFDEGVTVLDAARLLGVDLDSVCGGRGICGRCQIDVTSGEMARHGIVSHPSHLSAPNAVERRYEDRRGPLGGRRLGCQARLAGDLAVDVPPESQLHRQVVRKAATERTLVLNPAVRLHVVTVAEPDMHDPASDLTRLLAALEREWGLGRLQVGLSVIQGLQSALRAGGWTVTVAVRDGAEIAAIYPGRQGRAAGLAIDIGSTTIAAHLCDLTDGAILASAGVMNPQIRFGEDLMSRVSYAMLNAGGVGEMTAAVREAVNGLARSLADEASLTPVEIVDAVVVGNPVMHHLFLGIDPVELGGAPFALALDQAFEPLAHEVDLSIAPGARVHLMPCIAGHVGADAAAVVLSEAPDRQDKLMLIADVGTNAEIVLGNRKRLLACSSPTGPAFEGAQISAGQRAAPGAIERLRINRGTLEPRFKVIGCDLWSDEAGFAENTAKLGVTGLCGSGVIEAVAELYLAGVLRADGVIDGEMAARTARIESDGRTYSYVIQAEGPRIAITQNDIRAIQLAKAALHAGCKLLMDRYGAASVDKIVLAGAFGSYIDPVYAMALGLLPDCPLDQVTSAGNAAGTGAIMALLDRAARDQIAQTVARIEKIETALEPAFQQHFVDAMALPHATDPYPHLWARLEKPAASETAPRQRRRPA